MENDRALLLSEYILETRAYWLEATDVTWETGLLRAYLNGEFYNSFGGGERARIAQTRVSNKDNQWFGTPGGNDTDDYIFLLSLEEVVQYFGDSGQLANRPNDDPYNETWNIDDQYKEARMTTYRNGNLGTWWLRSPGANGRCVAAIDYYGGIRVGGTVVYSEITGEGNGGVRPAMWITL
ncbi:MAG: DUF6273 domain-containing protein [Oscillospiraceae bacterium]|nr:DUF6273 domain-containing protein [Oscillospiraceae bacterium]